MKVASIIIFIFLNAFYIMKKLKYATVGFTEYEQRLIYETLNDPRGWSYYGYYFVPSSKYDFLISKKSSREINSVTSSKELENLSVTFTGVFATTEVWINYENWTYVPKNFTGTRKEYRQYLLQHELGHVLGYGHVPMTHGKTVYCPVMYQQTKGTLNCMPNPWITRK